MSFTTPVPPWLWRTAAWGLAAAGLGVLALAAALALGLADPPRAGPLVWEQAFRTPPPDWAFPVSAGAAAASREGALHVAFTGAGQWAAALAPMPAGDFTLEVAGAQTGGALGAAQYGLVFDWAAETAHSWVLVNGNGYVEAAARTVEGVEPWFPFQQWPHVLYGVEANRVRVDVRGAEVTVRINDEVVFTRALARRAPGDRLWLGVLARSTGPSEVTFSWARLWAPASGP